ncbi:alpha/beta hydrolase [Bacillus thuringiensis]|uniref:alpha/beta hydrolase n=1 Tax=Bacillus thuringiensis TaxID=1428 RepID=UPI0021D67091|nr:alpha/beta fold hydrolase [Bacillus thuringiensis]MCU7667673.1 alpha/beta fold hydrolase [Bacillus thuringiensis]
MSKKQNESNSKSNLSKKKLLVTLGTSLLSVSSACVGLSLYVGLNLTRKKRRPIEDNPENHKLTYKDIEFKSLDGETNIKGWLLPTKEEPKLNIIMAHGYGGNRHNAGFIHLSKRLVPLGYQTLMFDFRNSGESEGKVTTIGAREKYDLLGAIEWIKTQNDKPIVLHGVSMGAATSILAAGMSQDVAGVIADSPYSDLKDYLKENLPVWTKLPAFPFTPLIMNTIPKIANIDVKEASPIQSLEAIYPRPVLFIHGNGDTKIPYTESEKMAALHPDAFEIWIPEGTDHVKGFLDYPKEYVKRITEFLMKFEGNK